MGYNPRKIVSILLTSNTQPINIMSYYTHNGNIIVQLGGMQISRKQLDAVKLTNPNCKTDQDAVDRLIQSAERAFNDVVEACEYCAEVELEDEFNEYGDRGGREYVSPDEHLSTAFCDAIRK